MKDHHRLAVERLAQHISTDPAHLALILGGSIAKGTERDDSDVDVLIVVTDQEFQRRREAGACHYYTTEFTPYEGGYVDGKFVDLGFLQDAAVKGSDPARSAFEGATVVWSRIPDLEALVKEIATYPEHEHQHRVEAFCGQLRGLTWYAGEAEKRNDPYLMTWVVSQVVLFACRLILAHNRTLYPFHKWLLTYVERAPEKPDQLLPLVHQLLANQTKENVQALCDCVLNWREWNAPPERWVIRFFEDVEWTWRYGKPGVQDW